VGKIAVLPPYIAVSRHVKFLLCTLSILLIPKILLLVKQIRPRTTQIDNLRAPISIFFQSRAFKAVKGVGDPFSTTDDALVLVVTEGAFVADAGEGRGAHVGVADGAFAVAFVAEAA
jgi:hypothetical protein